MKLHLFEPSGKHFNRRYPDWLPQPAQCDVCAGPVVMVHNGAIYGRPIGEWPWLYFCLCCAATVGCHKYSVYPKGRMADKEVSALRRELHLLFDPLWHGGSRTAGYQRLSEALQMPPWGRLAHIGEMDRATCLRALPIVQALAMADDFGSKPG